MKTVGGCVLLLLAEQAYAHANLVQFPNHIRAAEFLLPASAAAAICGTIMLVWGLWTEGKSAGACCHHSSRETGMQRPDADK